MGVEPGELDPPDTGRETLRVRLLGGMDQRLGDLALAPLDSARAESLLAYLLLHRDTPQPRQRLAFLLWPDSTESQALTNLRQVLFNLRHALPEADLFIDVQRRTLQWRAQAPLWLDVAIFEQAVAEGRLDDAVDVYGGDLLEGSYDDWLLDERERLAQLHLDALERLAVRLHGDGRWAEAIRYAERLLRHDPLREETHRLLMRLYSGSGDGGRALRVFHVCAATLQRELGIEPSAATRAVYEGLLAVEPADDAARAPGSLPAGAPLVGRSVERAQLTALWRDASRGRAQLVLVSGESGIGKSRLVDELRSWCGHRGAVTVEARAYAAEGTMAYGLVAGWLRAPGVLARVDRLAPADLTELARLMPDLLGRMPELPRPEPLPESEQRQRLFGAMARAIVRAGMPMLLVADDVQWCDAQSLQFVHYLLRAESQAPLLVAATVRREEIDAHHPVSEMIGSLQAAERITEIGLERLSRAETAILGERIRGRSLTDAEADGLYDESEGNPMFVVEALRLADEPSVAGSSPKVRGVIAARLAQLSPAAAELAGVAATIGREFTADVLADASGAEDAALVNGLDELWRRGLVRAHGPDAYDFSHGKIREAAYRALSPAQARNHHLHVARALERGRAAADAVSAQIAAHYEMAGASAEAVAWHRRAAGAAQRLHANADAAPAAPSAARARAADGAAGGAGPDRRLSVCAHGRRPRARARARGAARCRARAAAGASDRSRPPVAR